MNASEVPRGIQALQDRLDLLENQSVDLQDRLDEMEKIVTQLLSLISQNDSQKPNERLNS